MAGRAAAYAALAAQSTVAATAQVRFEVEKLDGREDAVVIKRSQSGLTSSLVLMAEYKIDSTKGLEPQDTAAGKDSLGKPAKYTAQLTESMTHIVNVLTQSGKTAEFQTVVKTEGDYEGMLHEVRIPNGKTSIPWNIYFVKV